MHKEDMELVRSVKEILEKDLREELTKIKKAGTFAPGQAKTLKDAVDAMFEMEDLEACCDNEYGEYSQGNYRRSYGNDYSGARGRSMITGRFVSRGVDNMDMRSNNHYMGPYYGRDSYEMSRSGHSTKDRMISALEDVMGSVNNDYEAQMVRDAIMDIQSRK